MTPWGAGQASGRGGMAEGQALYAARCGSRKSCTCGVGFCGGAGSALQPEASWARRTRRDHSGSTPW